MLIRLLLTLTLSLLAGGHSSAQASFDGKQVTCESTASSISIDSAKDKAVIDIDQFQITVDKSQVKWGTKEDHIDLPDGWKKLDLSDDGTRIVVTADGKDIGSITREK